MPSCQEKIVNAARGYLLPTPNVLQGDFCNETILGTANKHSSVGGCGVVTKTNGWQPSILESTGAQARRKRRRHILSAGRGGGGGGGGHNGQNLSAISSTSTSGKSGGGGFEGHDGEKCEGDGACAFNFMWLRRRPVYGETRTRICLFLVSGADTQSPLKSGLIIHASMWSAADGVVKFISLLCMYRTKDTPGGRIP